MKIATWNVNGIRAREKNVCRWLERVQPDLLLLQEIKCEEAAFPACFAAAGYRAAVVGQKGFNGVAVLARDEIAVTTRTLPHLPESDVEARYVEVAYGGLRVGNLYLPNGNSGGEAGFAKKLRFFDALAERAAALLDAETDFLLAGDYNVCPEDIDAAPGVLGPEDALMRPESRAGWRRLVWLGLTDALRAMRPTGPCYTFWDYQAGCWQKDRGLRIDHALLSPGIAERLAAASPDRQERGEDTPSDHVPLVLDLA